MLTNHAECTFNTTTAMLIARTSSGVAIGEVGNLKGHLGSSIADGMTHVASWWWHHVHVRVLFSVLLKHPARYCNA